MTKTTPKCFFDTLSETIDAAVERMNESKVLLVPDLATSDTLLSEGICSLGAISYGEHRRFDAAIVTLKNKPTKKYFHVNIWRSTEGRYELNTYVL